MVVSSESVIWCLTLELSRGKALNELLGLVRDAKKKLTARYLRIVVMLNLRVLHGAAEPSI